VLAATLHALKGAAWARAGPGYLDMRDESARTSRAGPGSTTPAKGHHLMGFGHRIYKVRDPATPDGGKDTSGTLPAGGTAHAG